MRWHRRRRVTQRLRGNLHQPFGLQAAHGGASNAGPNFTITGHQGGSDVR
jgi:hypothetical protein